jgi:ATP-dependent helicase YprA (DUF1998 family)
VRDLVQNRFSKRPCHFQIKVAQALYAGKDVVACAPTGAGKRLTFWIPILRVIMALEEGEDIMFRGCDTTKSSWETEQIESGTPPR